LATTSSRLIAFGIEELGHAELAAPFLARRIDVDADDPVGAGKSCALDHVEADPAEAEHDDVVADLDLGSVYHRPDARGHPAADVAAGLERRVLADLGHRDLGQHGEVREGRTAHVVKDRLALVREAAGAVGHQPLALRGADRGAQVGLAREARLTLTALGGVERDHVVARFDRGHPRPDLADDPRPLVAEDAREDALGIEPVQCVGVGVADAGRHDLDQHLAVLRPFEIELDDLERLVAV
jgi:hypothetical protein